MDWKKKILKNLEDEMVVLKKALETAKAAQRSAPSAMESHSDTTRSEMEKMVTALEINISLVEKNIKLMVDYEPKYYEINNGGQIAKIVLVPDGMGGKKIGDVMTISETSPVGKKLLQ